MYQDYKGFIHADHNGHSNGSGYFSLEEYVKTKIENINYSKFIGINVEMSKYGNYSIYAIVIDDEKEIIKYELKGVKEEFFHEAINGMSIMIFDKTAIPLQQLEETYKLETLPIK